MLSNTDLKVSRITLGCEVLGGADWGYVDHESAIDTVKCALELGINTFDTADVYGLGRSEEELSRALGYRRHDVIVITKGGVNWIQEGSSSRANTFYDSSPQHISKSIDDSLRRLRLDCVPIYLIHWPDPNTPVSETIETLLKCQKAGKIRYYGLSNFPISLIEDAHRFGILSTLEVKYSLLDTSAELDMFPWAQTHGVGIFAYGVLAQGLLSGKYDSDSEFELTDRRHRLEHFKRSSWATNEPILNRLAAVSSRYGKPMSQVSIRWVLDHPAVSSVIIGAKTPKQLQSNVSALMWRLMNQDRVFLTGKQRAVLEEDEM